MKEKLIKIADFLDAIGKNEEADVIDSIIDDTIEVPVSEYEQLLQVFESLNESLNNAK